MGKKLTSHASSLKISKNDNQKQQFNSLIKVLRPKVYITDISSFKKLVQELTGNGNGSSSATSSPPLEPKVVVSEEDIQTDLLEASLVSTKITTTTNDSSESCYTPSMNEEFNQVSNQMMCLDDTFLLEEYSMPNQTPVHDLLAYQNLESLLFDDEPNPLYDCYSQIEQEISIYDYELSGLL